MTSYQPLMPSPLDTTRAAAGTREALRQAVPICIRLGWLLRPHQSQQHSSAGPDNALITCPVTPPIRPSSPPGPGLIRQLLHTAQRDTDQLISAHSGC